MADALKLEKRMLPKPALVSLRVIVRAFLPLLKGRHDV
jgi:hypothetical protein